MRQGGGLAYKTPHPLTMVDRIEEQKRQKRLEDWYEKDGRADKDHPLHALYTGLAEKYNNEEGNA